ncbi:MAG: Crp/Fnr family transcriptional regulator, partial [Bacteroidia bacterium]
ESKESIEAITPCVVWSISFEELNKLFHGIPEFREFGRSLLVRGFAELKLRMQSVITETAEVRYLKLIESSSDIIKYAPLKYIASYLGVTDSSLSRIRKDTALQTTKKVN